ncbi:MAG: hypothetical protein C3F11_20055 [Methylocystaceae bacterium]|nr:MAG: hypothetical protein C3F11_20055 [Methylocystaceae bacterium]
MAGPAKNDAPRWEWRSFGADLSAIEAKIGLSMQAAPRRSEEIYLLNSATPHGAKIRGGALEVKRLLRVDRDGLELWSPAFRAAFPLSAQTLTAAFAALAVTPPGLEAKDYDCGAFLAEVVSRCEALRAVRVKKARRQFVFFECAAEFVRLQIGAVALESFAVESAEPARVLQALRELGLDSRLNVNFPKGVERAIALAA